MNMFLDTVRQPQADLVPPPIYAEVQRRSNGKHFYNTERALSVSVG